MWCFCSPVSSDCFMINVFGSCVICAPLNGHYWPILNRYVGWVLVTISVDRLWVNMSADVSSNTCMIREKISWKHESKHESKWMFAFLWYSSDHPYMCFIGQIQYLLFTCICTLFKYYTLLTLQLYTLCYFLHVCLIIDNNLKLAWTIIMILYRWKDIILPYNYCQ